MPTTPKIELSKKVVLLNETETISFSSEYANHYWIGIYKDNVLFNQDTISSNEYEISYKWVGKYDIAVVAINSCGSSESAYASFYVNDVLNYSILYRKNDGYDKTTIENKMFNEDYVITNAIPNRTGYKISTWNTKADGTGTDYAPGATYSENADLTLYAQWTKNHTHSYTSKTTKSATCTTTGTNYIYIIHFRRKRCCL